jgi:hypothetical protein
MLYGKEMEEWKTHNVIALDLVDFAPSIHNPTVIGSNDSDDIDTFALELVDLLNVWWEVESLAAGCESTWSNPSADVTVYE